MKIIYIVYSSDIITNPEKKKYIYHHIMYGIFCVFVFTKHETRTINVAGVRNLPLSSS